jgi:hypothetical protein
MENFKKASEKACAGSIGYNRLFDEHGIRTSPLNRTSSMACRWT